MKYRLVCPSILLAMACSCAFGQTENITEAVLYQIGNWNNAFVTQSSIDVLNKFILRQTGDNNQASIQQIQSGTTFLSNTSMIVQDGFSNAVGLIQNGGGNATDIRQYGNNNSSDLNIEGDGVRSAIVQQGNNNQVNQSLKGDGLNYVVTQQGNNIQLTQVESETHTRQYSVNQVGDGMRVIIVNGLPAK
jgi:hypothetical protein